MQQDVFVHDAKSLTKPLCLLITKAINIGILFDVALSLPFKILFNVTPSNGKCCLDLH